MILKLLIVAISPPYVVQVVNLLFSEEGLRYSGTGWNPLNSGTTATDHQNRDGYHMYL